MDVIRPLVENYKNDPITFVYVDKNEEKALHEQLGDSQYHMVVYKPKRGRYAPYKGTDFSTQSVKGFIDDVLGGSGDFKLVDGGELQLAGAGQDAQKADL